MLFSGRLCRQLLARQSYFDEAFGIRDGLLVEKHTPGAVPRARRIFWSYRNSAPGLIYSIKNTYEALFYISCLERLRLNH